MTGDALYLARTVSVRPFHDDPASSIEVVWGEGSERQSFVTESAQLASALATAPLETTLDDEVERLAGVLAVEATDAADLVAGLRAHGLYRDQPDDLSAAEERWLDVAWADALDLHLATRNAIWSHDYSGNPKVMRSCPCAGVKDDGRRLLSMRPITRGDPRPCLYEYHLRRRSRTRSTHGLVRWSRTAAASPRSSRSWRSWAPSC